MRTLRILLIATIALVSGYARADWFVAHMGQKICVPLDDIGANGERLYYHAGNMHTPEDFVRLFESLGSRVEVDPDHANTKDVFEFRVVTHSMDTRILLVDNEMVCKNVMSRMHP